MICHFTALQCNDGHTYVVIYLPERCMEASAAVGRWIADDRLNFGWRHAASILSDISDVRNEFLKGKTQ